MTTKIVSIKDIRLAKFNPISRTREGAIGPLLKSIQKYGRALVPVLVDQNMNLIDGHRRVECCKRLGIETIEASVVDVENHEEAWSDINVTAKRILNRDWFSAYVSGMLLENMPKSYARQISEMERLCGRKLIVDIANDEKRGRGHIYVVASALAGYCDDTSDRFMRAAINYMNKRGNQFLMRRAMAMCINPKTLRTKILNNRPVVLMAK